VAAAVSVMGVPPLVEESETHVLAGPGSVPTTYWCALHQGLPWASKVVTVPRVAGDG
jgi:hypothetical protein